VPGVAVEREKVEKAEEEEKTRGDESFGKRKTKQTQLREGYGFS